MLKEIFQDSFVWKTIQACRVAKVVFLIQIFFNFRPPLQSLLLRYTAENLQVT